jgi:predicted nucleotide-binding protein (sugar kinase/HSP70/actin superfamily)
MGTYIEAIELGADTIVTSGGNGPCRAGIYSEVHRKTLKNMMGYDVEFIVFDEFNRDPAKFMHNVRRIKGEKTWLRVCINLLTIYELARAVDRLQKIMEIGRAYELNRGSFNAAFQNIISRFELEAFSIISIRRLFREGMVILESVPCRKPTSAECRLRIGIVGEIYVVMEDSINMNIAEILNNLGCEVVRSMYISDWIDHNLCPKIFPNKSGRRLIDNSRQYMEIPIGGHGCDNIGCIIEYKKQGYDGVVHLMPFGCLPELVTRSIIPNIANDYRIPILSLSLDEQTSVANNLTRIEAFVELLKKNMERNKSQ